MKSIYFNRFGRALMAVLLTSAALPGSAPEASAQASSVLTNRLSHALPRRPSIILIVAEGLGYGDLSCYGQTRFQTPNLDRLAAEGIRFTDYYAGNTASSPARAALLLGKDAIHLPQRAGASVPLGAGDLTIAQLLKQTGYHTGLIGGWDLGDDRTGGAPWKKGFDEFAGYLSPSEATNYYADYMWRYAPGAILRTNHQREDFIGKEMLYPNTGGRREQYIPDLLTKAALNFVKNNQPDKFNFYRPFFLLLDYTIPGAGNGPVPTDAPYSEEPWPQPQRNKAALISRLDGYIGQLRQQLQDLGLTNNVVMFFTSDTGPQKGRGVDPDFFHSLIASNSLRVPMSVRWPDRIPTGQVSAYAWTASDFLPTATDIALIQAPAGVDGRSVLPVLMGQTQTNRHDFIRK